MCRRYAARTFCCCGVAAQTQSLLTTIGQGFSGTIAEVVVWSDTVLSSAEIAALVQVHRVKWEIVMQPTPIVTASSGSDNSTSYALLGTASDNIPYTGALSKVHAPLPSFVGQLPPPQCWLDASDPSTLFSDTENGGQGFRYTKANGRVQVWRDRSGNRCHCKFSTAMWLTSDADAIHNRLPVVHTGSAPGLFSSTLYPLSSRPSSNILLC